MHDTHAGTPVSRQAMYATRVRPMAGSRPVIPPKPVSDAVGQVQQAAWSLSGASPAADAGLLPDPRQWDALRPEDLIEQAGHIQPKGLTGQCVHYAAPDLVWAEALKQEELNALYSAPAPRFVAGMGFSNVGFWEELAAGNAEVLRWVHGGYSEFVAEVVPYSQHANNANTGGDNAQFVTDSVAELLAVGAVVDVTSQAHDVDTVRVVAPLTVAVQGNGKQRLCWNGIPVNRHLAAQSFKMEHAEQAAKMMRPGDYMFSLDMKAGYHQVPVKPWFRKFLCFRWGEGAECKTYQWQVMPFGLSTAPRAYTKLCRRLLQRWRAKGVRCSNYIDDFIFFASSMAQALDIRAMVLADLTRLGWFVSPSKSMLQPGTMIEYLGLVFCSLPAPHVRLPYSKLARAQQLFDGVLKKASQVGDDGVRAGLVRTTGVHLVRALGFLQSLRLAVSLVPMFTRELYACLNQLPRVQEGWFEYGGTVVLTSAAVEECRVWQRRLPRWNGFVVAPAAVTRVVYTDGCGDGFGGLVHRVMAREQEPALQLMAGSWETAMPEDSVMTELEGLWRTVLGAGRSLVGQVVLHRTDSISTYAVVNKGGSSRSSRLTAVARRLQVYCLMQDITLATQYVGAGVIIRSGADLLSRAQDASDGGKLNPAVFARIWRVWGPFAADMFASAATVQADGAGAPLPYWSMLADGKSCGVDALSADWGSLGRVYAFPPVSLVGQVLQLVHEQGARVLLICPKWPAQWWWPLVLERAVMGPVELSRLHVPSLDGPLFVQGRRHMVPHPLGDFVNRDSVEWVAVWLQP